MNLHRDKFISGCKFDGTNSKNASNLVPNAINKDSHDEIKYSD